MFSPRRAIPILLLLAPFSFAQEKDLPKGDEIMDKYVAATGGKEAYSKFKSRVTTGTMEVPAMNVKGKVTMSQKAPNLMLTVLEIDNLGKIVQGTDGKIAWELNPITGDRILDGEEKANFMREADFLGEANWRDAYQSAECTAIEDVDGKPAYKVVLTPKEGTPVTAFYDKESGLLVQQSITAKSPMGDIQVTITPADYKEVDGIKIPHTSVQQVLTQTIKTSFDSIKHNEDIPASTFELPDAIKKLMK